MPVGIRLGRIARRNFDQKTLFLWCYGLLAVAAAKPTLDAGLALLR